MRGKVVTNPSTASETPDPTRTPIEQLIRRRIAIPAQTAFTGSSMFGALARTREPPKTLRRPLFTTCCQKD